MSMTDQVQQVRGGATVAEILSWTPQELDEKAAWFPDLYAEYYRRITGRVTGTVEAKKELHRLLKKNIKN